jgi:hypothetical protein
MFANHSLGTCDIRRFFFENFEQVKGYFCGSLRKRSGTRDFQMWLSDRKLRFSV